MLQCEVCDVALLQVLCADCQAMASTETAQLPKVERSAGRMPGQVFSASFQMGQLTRRHAELMRRAPPPRTPPSIPLPKARSLMKGRSPRSGPMLAELEHHARSVQSPRSFMQHGQLIWFAFYRFLWSERRLQNCIDRRVHFHPLLLLKVREKIQH